MTPLTPAPPAVRLGVDYGSSNTVAVLATADGRARTLLFDGVPLLPSAVYASPEGRLLVGRDATRAARLDPSRYEPNPKRRVDDGEVLLGDTAHPVTDLVAAVLRRVADEAVRVAGQPLDEVTLTCPVTWGEHRRGHLVAAARAAGLGTPSLVPEPVAAARYFAARLRSPAVVYDLGAGTFDVTVVRATPGADLEILAGDGLADLGGADFDAFVVAQLAAAVAVRFPPQWRRLTAPATDEDRRASAALWQEAQAAKETLSRHPTASVMVPLTGEVVHVTREAFEEAAAETIAATTRLTLRTVAAAGLTPADVRAVYLVGGAPASPPSRVRCTGPSGSPRRSSSSRRRSSPRAP